MDYIEVERLQISFRILAVAGRRDEVGLETFQNAVLVRFLECGREKLAGLGSDLEEAPRAAFQHQCR